jgi:tRNA(Ile)-lysidine synthase
MSDVYERFKQNSEQLLNDSVQLNSLRFRQDEFKSEAARGALIREHSARLPNSLVSALVNDAVAVAVSGGSDSIALLLLLRQNPNIKITVLTVNHHLRKEAEQECDYVLSFAKNLGLDAIKFDWYPEDNISNLQSRARAGRYELMTNYCLKNNIPVLLTAHHLDDNIENFLIRQKRKSGIFGLSSSNVHYINGIKIIRPLFNIRKQELVDYLIVNDVKWFEDSSNYSDKYVRSGIRKFLADASHEFKENIIKQQEEIDAQLPYLQEHLNAALAESCKIYSYGFAVIRLDELTTFEEVIKLQLLSYILTIIGGQESGPRARLLYPILISLDQKQDFIRTLHGTAVKKIGDNLLIYRLFGKKIPVDVKFSSLWDNRFIVHRHPELVSGSKPLFNEILKQVQDDDVVYISSLSRSEYSAIKDRINLSTLRDLSFKHHLEILFTLPVIKTLEKIIAIPHISFYNEADFEAKIELRPKYNSRFINFSQLVFK